MFPKFYCISRYDSPRRDRMKTRFEELKLNYEFVPAVSPDSSIVEYYTSKCHNWYITDWENIDQYNIDLFKKDAACYAAHMGALRTVVESGLPYAIICEDDIVFHRNLKTYIHQILDLKELPNLISFCYMISDLNMAMTIHPEMWELRSFDPYNTWGAQMYFITREYATWYLGKYDHPFRHKITSEFIIQRSDGYLHCPPLALEEGVDSERKEEDLPFHHYHFGVWPSQNYLEPVVAGSDPMKQAYYIRRYIDMFFL